MPVPGPRTQHGPDTGYRNPESRAPNFFNHWNRPDSIWWPGQTPGMMIVTLRGCVLGAGQIRRLWRQSIDMIPAQAGFSWTDNAPSPGRPVVSPGGFHITRALRYMSRSIYMGGGIDNTRYEMLHTHVAKQNMYKTVTINRGQTRSRPTVRNRLTSFGSRVPTLNTQVQAAEGQCVGRGSQA